MRYATSTRTSVGAVRGLVLDYVGVLTDTDADELYDALEELRGRGIRTALLSNADGASTKTKNALKRYFDALVFSGEVGVGKPDEEVYRLTAELLKVPVEACVFVDDAARNVRGAIATGMVGVHHTSVGATLAELSALFPA